MEPVPEWHHCMLGLECSYAVSFETTSSRCVGTENQVGPRKCGIISGRNQVCAQEVEAYPVRLARRYTILGHT